MNFNSPKSINSSEKKEESQIPVENCYEMFVMKDKKGARLELVYMMELMGSLIHEVFNATDYYTELHNHCRMSITEIYDKNARNELAHLIISHVNIDDLAKCADHFSQLASQFRQLANNGASNSDSENVVSSINAYGVVTNDAIDGASEEEYDINFINHYDSTEESADTEELQDYEELEEIFYADSSYSKNKIYLWDEENEEEEEFFREINYVKGEEGIEFPREKHDKYPFY